MKKAITILLVVCAVALASCHRLSKEAREITGIYFNTELSQTDPVMELRSDATCTVRAIRPGVLTYSVDGTWNVERDSLIILLDPSTLEFSGDSLVIGDIPARNARKILGHNEFSLQLEQDGAQYMYKRQNSN